MTVGLTAAGQPMVRTRNPDGAVRCAPGKPRLTLSLAHPYSHTCKVRHTQVHKISATLFTIKESFRGGPFSPQGTGLSSQSVVPALQEEWGGAHRSGAHRVRRKILGTQQALELGGTSRRGGHHSPLLHLLSYFSITLSR